MDKIKILGTEYTIEQLYGKADKFLSTMSIKFKNKVIDLEKRGCRSNPIS